MFTLATYLGYVLTPEMPVVGALIATLAVFLPGFLLLLGVLKTGRHWLSARSCRSHARSKRLCGRFTARRLISTRLE